ncbi:hypothetical protein [Rhodococcus sp. HNM0569]|uniref:hypothetical protein n=1 Tax=Rhodococcus sp. HNM0569 TaxID=2716340 RepID=UPI00146F3ED7|nr:hypothetical protein [Rhodococcus sp. HNM0569]NLU83238.1 hypothetical protein [Rhodococcus sp. HNM0569]
MRHKFFAAAAATALTAAGLAFAATPATAEPAPQLQILGPDLLLAPAGDCYGSLHTRTENLHTPEGDVRMTFTPTGTWGTHPGCTVQAWVGEISGATPVGQRHDVVVDSGPTSIDLRLGKGLSMLTPGSNQPFGMGGGGYTWVDPLG